MDKITKTDEQWREQLDAQQFEVTRRAGTERAFTGKYHDCKVAGTYLCVCCRAPLFASAAKFDSGTGWPSFYQPLSAAALQEKEDRSFFQTRTEVLCARCDAHLGHVFPDGPAPTGLRYCMNSAALHLQASDDNTNTNAAASDNANTSDKNHANE